MALSLLAGARRATVFLRSGVTEYVVQRHGGRIYSALHIDGCAAVRHAPISGQSERGTDK